MASRLFPLLLVPGLSAAAPATVEVEPAGRQSRFTLEDSAVSDLSGLTWIAGDEFAAVSDKQRMIQHLHLQIDRATGALTDGKLGSIEEVPAKAGDFEGVAWVSGEKAFFVAAEEGNSVIRFVPRARAAIPLTLPAVFAKARPNLGLEALTWNEDARVFWIANEEALVPDGPPSSATAGTMVRLQKLDARCRPLAQYAWRTEPAAFRYGQAGSGVSDLCVLPDGQLLVLERGFAEGGLHLRLFLANLAAATDVSRRPGLNGAALVPAGKTLLYEETTGFINFEGLTLGPPLANGWRSLIVVADSNGSPTHSFLALKVRSGAKPARNPVRPGARTGSR
jgi:hypothetical protein